jgi:trehalose 6-phosphate synthase
VLKAFYCDMPYESPDHQIVVLSNREPYRHERGVSGQLHSVRCSSGVVNAVEPLLLDRGGVWVAAGEGDADSDAADEMGRLDVPRPQPRYRLRRVWVSAAERHLYCDGFANQGLWPLCHRTTVPPVFDQAAFRTYELINRRFADAVADEVRTSSPVVLVQDYHFALAAELIRRQLPLARIATFWHVPWPARETLQRCPWSDALLEGLLGSTLIGFQTPLDCDNFLRCAECFTQIDVAASRVHWKGREVRVGVYPTSVAAPGEDSVRLPSVAKCRAEIRKQLRLAEEVTLGVGVDRVDYTKGIEEKFLAIERLLECRPDLRHRVVFVQIAEPSRQSIPTYQQTNDRIVRTMERINARYHGGPPPIVLLNAHHDRFSVLRFLRAADFCFVGSLHDGMNLVSKEFVAAREDEQGVLVLSAFAGSSYELRDALIVNPYDIEQVARTLAAAIDMPAFQRCYRMRRMRRVVTAWNAHTWAERILADVTTEGELAVKPFASHLCAAL